MIRYYMKNLPNKFILSLFVLVMLVLNTSCGLAPLNKISEKNYKILSSVKVTSVTGTNAPYKLKAYLEDQLNPLNANVRSNFNVEVTLNQTLEDLIIKREATVARKNLAVIAKYKLYDIKTRKLLKSDTVRVINSFDEVASPFASFYKEEKAYNDALQEIARSMKNRIISDLSRNGYMN